MARILFPSLLLMSALSVAGCDKSSEDHVQDANKHTQAAQQKQAEGNTQQAATEKTQASEDQAKAREARTTEDRHQAPTSDMPGYLKSPDK
jgi:hypothetical protein